MARASPVWLKSWQMIFFKDRFLFSYSLWMYWKFWIFRMICPFFVSIYGSLWDLWELPANKMKFFQTHRHPFWLTLIQGQGQNTSLITNLLKPVMTTSIYDHHQQKKIDMPRIPPAILPKPPPVVSVAPTMTLNNKVKTNFVFYS